MIHIVYKVKPSKVHGVGLFADQDIKKGDLIYTPNSLLDVDLTEEQFKKLSPSEQKEVEYYGYLNKKTNKWHVAFEMIRILNHGSNGKANVTQNEDMIMTAKRGIKKGEELLQDYIEIYPPEGEHFKKINKK
ncbi:MAG: SET domain-containing protein [Candidatus Staskawiczbacteria bacterium]|jgi:hypothetical protein